MIIAGGGVQYSRAVAALTGFAESHQIPVVETIAGRANLLATHPLNIGPIGVTGSDSANAIAERADVIVAVGTPASGFHPPDRGPHFPRTLGSSRSMPRAMTRQAYVAAGRGRCQTVARRVGPGGQRLQGIRRLGVVRAERTPQMGCLCDRQHSPRKPPEFLRPGHRRCERSVRPPRPGCRLGGRIACRGYRKLGERWMWAPLMWSSGFPAWGMKFPVPGAHGSRRPSARPIRIPSCLLATARS